MQCVVSGFFPCRMSVRHIRAVTICGDGCLMFAAVEGDALLVLLLGGMLSADGHHEGGYNNILGHVSWCTGAYVHWVYTWKGISETNSCVPAAQTKAS